MVSGGNWLRQNLPAGKLKAATSSGRRLVALPVLDPRCHRRLAAKPVVLVVLRERWPWQSRMGLHDARMGFATVPFASLCRRA